MKKKQFEIFVVQTLGGTIYPLSKATWSVLYSGVIAGKGNNEWVFGKRFDEDRNWLKSKVTGGTGTETDEKPKKLVPPVVNDALNLTHEGVDNGWRLA